MRHPTRSPLPRQTGLRFGLSRRPGGICVGSGSLPLSDSSFHVLRRRLSRRTVGQRDRNTHRHTKAGEIAADLVVDAAAQDPVTSELEWTQGRGVDFAIDAVGTAQCRQNSIACAASGGTVICIGLEDEVCAVDTRPVVTREVDVKGAYAYTRPNFAEAISMLERRLLPWQPLVTKAGLLQGQAIFKDLASGNSTILKAVFEI
ncbi:MAG: hypothetical protein DMG58_29860 [Acidobacteria bacterium]|nr:MAG: hypothetical protein DMG58_29860 [Acidobacteriota bacterium]